VSFKLAHNGPGLGEGGEYEAQNFLPALPAHIEATARHLFGSTAWAGRRRWAGMRQNNEGAL